MHICRIQKATWYLTKALFSTLNIEEEGTSEAKSTLMCWSADAWVASPLPCRMCTARASLPGCGVCGWCAVLWRRRLHVPGRPLAASAASQSAGKAPSPGGSAAALPGSLMSRSVMLLHMEDSPRGCFAAPARTLVSSNASRALSDLRRPDQRSYSVLQYELSSRGSLRSGHEKAAPPLQYTPSTHGLATEAPASN